MNIFWHELKTYRKSIVVWTVSLSLLVMMFLSLFPAFSSDVDSSMKLLQNLPVQLRDALGISLSDFFTIFGFYGYLFTFVTLAGGVQAMNLGLGLVAKEFSGNTADFLLAKPVTRSSVLTQKLLAGITGLLITNIVFVAVALMSAAAVSKDGFSVVTFLLLSFTLLLIQLVFFVLGIFFAVTVPKIRSVIAFSLPVTFGFFIVGSLGAIIGNTAVRYVTPFKFYDPEYIIKHHAYEWKYVLVEGVVVLLALVLSYALFSKKDVPTA